jgi:hypothetical protein
MITSYIHPRLGLTKFLAFQPFFIAALEEYEKGNDTKFTALGGLSANTVAARMRDSLAGYRINAKLWSDRIDPHFIELMNRCDGLFVIAGPDLNGDIWLRARHKTGEHKPGQLPFCEVEGTLDKHVRRTVLPAVQTPAPAQIIRPLSNDQEVVKLFCALKGRGEIPMPVIFTGPIETSISDEMLRSYDISISYNPERNETIIM